MNSKKVALVTGATGGIGAAIAKELAKQGYQLWLQGRDLIKLEALCDELPGSHRILVADLTQQQARNELITAVKAEGKLNLLINNAGIAGFGELAQISPEQIAEIININLTVPMLISQALLPTLVANQGSLINIGSAFGSIGFPGFSSYCASKFGLRGFTEALSREFADSDVTIGYFAPRATQTDINCVQVNEMNNALGTACDTPEFVAQQLIKFINNNSKRQVLGWPEKLFARLNGVLPEVVDSALKKKLSVIKQYSQSVSKEC